MLDIGWSELLVVAGVALVVIGPKDLPRALHTAGKWVRRARSVATDFQRTVDRMMEEADLAEANEDLKKIRRFDPRAEIGKMVGDIGGKPSAPGQSEPASVSAAEVPGADAAVAAAAEAAGTSAPAEIPAGEATPKPRRSRTPKVAETADLSATADKVAKPRASAKKKAEAGEAAAPAPARKTFAAKASSPAKPKAAAPKAPRKTAAKPDVSSKSTES
ncbi:Sec-independent protein translocase protein TatB [Radicibacter daui]|uniref:Sec-independent protein translocase protein TatB n=1 Tax=Radicibacter daui TaxID=3064829 RepID=UPI004046A664